MIRVALVEDEESSQRALTEYLERFSQEINEKIHVSIFPDGAEIVDGDGLERHKKYSFRRMTARVRRGGNDKSIPQRGRLCNVRTVEYRQKRQKNIRIFCGCSQILS